MINLFHTTELEGDYVLKHLYCYEWLSVVYAQRLVFMIPLYVASEVTDVKHDTNQHIMLVLKISLFSVSFKFTSSKSIKQKQRQRLQSSFSVPT